MTPPVMGAVVVPCSKCGRAMRVEVTGEVSPIARTGFREMNVHRGGETVGVFWWQIRAAGTDHTCPRRAPLRRAS